MNGDDLRLAHQLCAEQRYDDALEAYRRAGGAEGAYGEAVCLRYLGRDDQVREALGRCLSLDPEHTDAKMFTGRSGAAGGRGRGMA